VVTGSLPVRVLDENGVGVAGATVTLKSVETGLEFSQTTNQDGLTTFVSLTPGKYKIAVVEQRFKTTVIDSFAVGVSRTEVLELRLERRLARDIASIIQPELVVTEDLLEDLPNINKDLSRLLEVVPGAAAANAAGLGRIVPDAKGKEQQTLKLDGLDVTPLTDLPTGDPLHGVVDSLLKTNVALNSPKTVTHAGSITFEPANGAELNYALSPMYGPGTGTVIEGVSFTGTDGGQAQKWKFQLSEAVRNDALNARNFFEHDGRNPLRRNHFGGKVGGPLVNGRLALFFGYDGIRARSERVIHEAVPIDAVCLCGGPVAPFLGSFLPPGTTIVPGEVSKNPDFLVARRRVRSSSDANAWDARFDVARILGDDYAFLTLRFTHQEADFVLPDGVTGRNQRQGLTLTNGLAKLTLLRLTHEHSLKFGITQTRSHSFVEVPPATDPTLLFSAISVGGTVQVSNLPGDPAAVSIATLGGLVRNTARGIDQTPISFNPSYDLIARLGPRQRIETGFEARFIRMDFDRFGGLTYAFPDIAALRAGTASSVNFLSDLSAASPFTEGGRRRAKQKYYLSYFQMRSNFSPRFVLTYGLRYDYFGVPKEQDDRAVVVDPHSATILPRGTQFYRASKTNFQPRVGLSYRFSDNTTLRAGAGLFTNAPRIGDLLLPIESDRFNTNRNTVAFPVTPAELIEQFLESPDNRQFQPLSFARDFTTPERVLRWDVMLTHTIRRFNDLNFLYSANIGRNLAVANIANPIISVQTDPDPTRPAIVRRQFDIERDGLLFKPFGELQHRTSKGRSSFNGLTVQFKRNNVNLGTSEHWLDWQNFKTFNAQYTFGRNVGNVSGAVAASTLNFEDDFGFNASDVRHVFSLSTSYRLWDDTRGRNRRDIIWGWTISPSITARSGLPLIVRLDRPDIVFVDATGQIFSSPGAARQAVINTPGGGASGGARVPDLIPGVNPFLRDGVQLLNPAAFAVPAPGQFGNLKRGQLRGPGSFQFDLAFTRVLLHEPELRGGHGISADLKIELTNLLNRVNFSNPVAVLPNVLGVSAAGDRIQPGVPFTRLTAGPTFGVFNAADAGRQIQFTLTFKFNEGF
jgi:hypothetical protein